MNKRLVVFLIVALCCVLLSHSQLTAVGVTVFDEIECTKLTVVDKTGKTAIRLYATESENHVLIHGKAKEPGIQLSTSQSRNDIIVNGKEKSGVSLSATELGSGLAVFDEVRKRAIQILGTESENFVAVYDKKGGLASQLTANKFRNGVSLHGKGMGKSEINLITNEEGSGLSFFDKTGKLAIFLSSIEGVFVYDKAGNVAWRAP